MKRVLLCLAATALFAQTPVRHAIAPSTANGWARVVVDDDGADGIWIGDAQGRSVPFLWESDATWSTLPLTLLHPIWGKDAQGRSTGAFTLHPPEGFSRGDREQVKLECSLQASTSPWMVGVKVERRGNGGAFIALDDAPRFLYDLGPDRRATSITIPWDGDDYRLTLIPTQGATPKLLGVEASACTLPSELKADERMALVFQPAMKGDGFKDLDHADLGATHQLIALEVVLRPPTAPVAVSAVSIYPDRDGAIHEPVYLGASELWNLPALSTQHSRIAVDRATRFVHLNLPSGVQLESATALIRHRRLFFPAEAGAAYFLHGGGLENKAPGSLAALPASSRAFYAGKPLALGPAEPDPQAVQAAPDAAAKVRRWLPWGAGVLVVLLGFWGLRLFKGPQD